jgi:hypothetical protein
MQITGTITQVGPASAPSGQYQVRYQDVTITDDQNGKQWYGRIGSKQGYQGGEQVAVTVEVKQGQDGTYNYFKKFNPQYAPQNAPQAPQQPPQATKPPQQGRNGREVSIERQAAFKAACEYAGRLGVDGETLIKIAIAGHYFIETGENSYLKNPVKPPESLRYDRNQPPPQGDEEVPF